MPYIEIERREEFAKNPNAIPLHCGELNYKITMVMLRVADLEIASAVIFSEAWEYWQSHPQKYQSINDILGAFVGAEREFRRRTGSTHFRDMMEDVVDRFYEHVAGPYENGAIARNGDLPYADY